MRSDTVCVCIGVGGWHEIKIAHTLPVAKQTEYNVCEMTFALPEEFSVSPSCGFAFRMARRKESEGVGGGREKEIKRMNND